MLTVTARIFSNSQLVGYRLSDGQSTQDLTKIQAWAYAKNKQIANVVATGNEQEPGLSGINGFELKKLPEVQPASVKYNTQDILSAGLRMIMDGFKPVDINSGEELMSVYKSRLKEDSQKGVVGAHNVRTLSQYFTVINTLSDKNAKGGSIEVVKPTGEELEKQRKEFESIKAEKMQAYNELKTREQNTVANIRNLRKNANNLDKTTKAKALQSLVDLIDSLIEISKQYENNDNEQLVTLKNELDLVKTANVGTANVGTANVEDNIEILEQFLVEITKLESYIDETIGSLSQIEFVPKRQLCTTTPVIGYLVKYTGATPIQISRINVNTYKQNSVTLNPNEQICLSRPELNMLGAKPEIGCTFSNGKIVASSKIRTYKNTYEGLFGPYFAVEKGYEALEKICVQDVADSDTVNNYFIKLQEVQAQTKISKATHQQETAKNLKNSKGLFGMMKAFDRK